MQLLERKHNMAHSFLVVTEERVSSSGVVKYGRDRLYTHGADLRIFFGGSDPIHPNIGRNSRRISFAISSLALAIQPSHSCSNAVRRIQA